MRRYVYAPVSASRRLKREEPPAGGSLSADQVRSLLLLESV